MAVAGGTARSTRRRGPEALARAAQSGRRRRCAAQARAARGLSARHVTGGDRGLRRGRAEALATDPRSDRAAAAMTRQWRVANRARRALRTKKQADRQLYRAATCALFAIRH